MGGVGDVLEAVYSGPDPRPLHAVVSERRDAETARRVEKAAGKAMRIPLLFRIAALPMVAVITLVHLPSTVAAKLRRSPPEPGPASELTVSLEASGRARVVRSWDSDAGPQRAAAAVRVGRMAFRHRGGHWPAPNANDVERLFDRNLLRDIVGALDLAFLREDEVAGRHVAVVRAVRRGPHGLWPHWLPFGADRYELSFDREYGTLLAYRAFAGDTAYDEVTVTRITYGDPGAPDQLIDTP